jgi:hypothetical protein
MAPGDECCRISPSDPVSLSPGVRIVTATGSRSAELVWKKGAASACREWSAIEPMVASRAASTPTDASAVTREQLRLNLFPFALDALLRAYVDNGLVVPLPETGTYETGLPRKYGTCSPRQSVISARTLILGTRSRMAPPNTGEEIVERPRILIRCRIVAAVNGPAAAFWAFWQLGNKTVAARNFSC